MPIKLFTKKKKVVADVVLFSTRSPERVKKGPIRVRHF